jgi:hypothetical protein
MNPLSELETSRQEAALTYYYYYYHLRLERLQKTAMTGYTVASEIQTGKY